MKISRYCAIYFLATKKSRKKGLRFFKEPVKVYKDEIEYFKTSSKEKFCTLELLVLFNNGLYVSDLI